MERNENGDFITKTDNLGLPEKVITGKKIVQSKIAIYKQGHIDNFCLWKINVIDHKLNHTKSIGHAKKGVGTTSFIVIIGKVASPSTVEKFHLSNLGLQPSADTAWSKKFQEKLNYGNAASDQTI